jgi:flagellar FliJ protein
MNRSSRLQPVIQIAKSKEDLAAKQLAACQKRIDEGETQLERLLNFLTEYSHGLQVTAHAGMSSRQFCDYTDFISRLELAVQQQRKVLRQLKSDCELKRQHWLVSRAKSKVLDKLFTHYVIQEMAIEARREQAEADDRAQLPKGNIWES